MFVLFNQLSEHARIWIYQMDRAVSGDEQEIINSKMTSFCKHWKAHEKPLRSSFKVFYDQFLVLAVDEQFNPIGGCSIDGSTRAIRELERELSIDLLNRTYVACWIEGQIKVYSIERLKHYMAVGSMNPDTPVFNNLITTKKDLEKNWKIPVKASWVARQLCPI